eukprot:3177025-Alexandrium_andersonii.AAC.1
MRCSTFELSLTFNIAAFGQHTATLRNTSSMDTPQTLRARRSCPQATGFRDGCRARTISETPHFTNGKAGRAGQACLTAPKTHHD